MMLTYSESISIHTHGKGTTEMTSNLQNILKKSNVSSGLMNVFVRHTSASLVIMENADPSARRDLERFFDHLVPEYESWYTHTCEGPDDMPSHIRMALTRTSESIPIINGNLALGTWQGVFLFEHRNMPHHREIIITILGNK